MGRRFEVKSKQHLSGGIVKIVVDLYTGVNYLMTSGIGLSGMTPLLDKDGKVVVDEVKR
ncbi:DUF6440 family protein [Exiguobacterium profundum]|uniref:DUF6440 family protein n=1 Tax=Exiguobacterium TaxID=33986 RepID=UPI001BED0ABD|nr:MULTISPECIES: DUF6440 family protein [Exiguobacterium]MDX5981526.1 DUF6440 family protein [Exiguobacterium profundum]